MSDRIGSIGSMGLEEGGRVETNARAGASKKSSDTVRTVLELHLPRAPQSEKSRFINRNEVL